MQARVVVGHQEPRGEPCKWHQPRCISHPEVRRAGPDGLLIASEIFQELEAQFIFSRVVGLTINYGSAC